MTPSRVGAKRRLVLVGAGHVHLRVLARWEQLSSTFDVSLVAPHDARYGGAVAPMLAGEIEPARLRIKPPGGARIIRTRALGAKPRHRRLWLADGRVLPYDALGLNTGTRQLPRFALNPAAGQPWAWSGHSMTDLVGLRAALAVRDRAVVVVAGGSTRAWEIVGGLSAAGGPRVRVVLLLPAGLTGRADRAAAICLARRGVDIVPVATANALGEGCVQTADGRRFAADHLVWAGPPTASGLAQALGLSITNAGVRVDRRLQSPGADAVFVAGALASLDGRQALPGWDAERQAEVFIGNLLGRYDTRALSRYRVSRRHGWPLDLGANEIVSTSRLRRSAHRRLRVERHKWMHDRA